MLCCRTGGRRGSEDTRIYVSNIPYEYKWQDLKDLFRKEGELVGCLDLRHPSSVLPIYLFYFESSLLFRIRVFL